MSSHPKNTLLAAVLLAWTQAPFAQQLPDAGRQLQQITAPPELPKAAPALPLEPAPAPPRPSGSGDQPAIAVERLRITGAQAYPQAELLALTGFKPGSALTLGELQAMAGAIAAHYRRQGYFLAQAYVPAQDVQDGTVTIAVMEGHYGGVTVRNEAGVSPALLDAQLQGLKSGGAITAAPLEKNLLLLSDLPGLNVKSTLVPGASVGTSDLIVEVTPGQRLSGSVDADNHGNHYTGRERVGATLHLNNPSGHGDVASLRLFSAGSGLDYGRAAYQTQLGRSRVGVAYAAMNYALGRDFESLQAHGKVHIASVYASHPLLRSRRSNLSAQLAFDAKTFQDRQDATATLLDKKAKVTMASLSGDARDDWFGPALTTYALTWTSGRLELQTPAALALDAASARSNGRYHKLGFDAARLQALGESTTLYADLSGQFASKNLDNSEKMSLGGANAVRAYPEGEASGDQGYVLTLEARQLLPRLWERQSGQFQLVGFIDTGSVTLSKAPWGAAGEHNRKSLSGAGLGLSWTDNTSFVVKAYYARKLGSAAATSAPDASGRWWLQAVKYF